jgi:hypothetical protein
MQEIMKEGMKWFDRQVVKENAGVSDVDFKAIIDACDPLFAAVEPFTKRANHRYNIRHCYTCPPSDAVHKEVAGYTDREDFEPYTETYLDAHTAAIEALSSTFDNLVGAFDALQNDDHLYSTYAELLRASSNLYEFNLSAYSKAAECAATDALKAQLKDAKETLAAIELLESKAAYAQATAAVAEAEAREVKNREFEQKAKDAGSRAEALLGKNEKGKARAEKTSEVVSASVRPTAVYVPGPIGKTIGLVIGSLTLVLGVILVIGALGALLNYLGVPKFILSSTMATLIGAIIFLFSARIIGGIILTLVDAFWVSFIAHTFNIIVSGALGYLLAYHLATVIILAGVTGLIFQSVLFQIQARARRQTLKISKAYLLAILMLLSDLFISSPIVGFIVR